MNVTEEWRSILFKNGIDIPSMCMPIQYKNKPLVYIIDDGEFVKIGYTNDLSRRLKDLQTANAKNLNFRYAMECKSKEDALEIEHMLHCYFSNKRLIGEWFDILNQLPEIIAMLNGDMKEGD